MSCFFATESYFVQGCEDAESSEIRFRLCQELWDEIKTDTEVRTDVQQEGQKVDFSVPRRKYVLKVKLIKLRKQLTASSFYCIHAYLCTTLHTTHGFNVVYASVLL